MHQETTLIEPVPENINKHMKKAQHRQKNRNVIDQPVNQFRNKVVFPSGINDVEKEIQSNYCKYC